MLKGIYLGPRGGETLFKAPGTDGDASPIGWESSSQLLNGGADARNSVASHMEYTYTWPLSSRDTLRPLSDIAGGKRGPGLVYLLDPMSLDKNVLNEQWSMPFQAGYDAPPIWGDTRPSLISTPDNDFDYPMESAVYDMTTGVGRSFYLPIPPGHTAWVGVHGSTDGTGGIQVLPVNGNAAAGVARTPALLSVDTATRFNDSFSGVGGITLTPVAGTSTTLTLSGLMVQILKNNVAPSGGDFVSGQGNSGCRMSKPSRSPYSARFDLIGMSAKFTEIGDWISA